MREVYVLFQIRLPNLVWITYEWLPRSREFNPKTVGSMVLIKDVTKKSTHVSNGACTQNTK